MQMKLNLYVVPVFDGLTLFFAPEKLLVLLRDGRKLMGTLRSFDQFGNFLSSCHIMFDILPVDNLNVLYYLHAANAVLEGACERVIIGDLYCDIPLGLYVIRGENVVLIGELVWLLISFHFILQIFYTS